MTAPFTARPAFRAAALALLLSGAAAPGRDWPQVGGNPQRTNFTPDSPAPPYKAVWAADFAPEVVYTVPAVIAGGRVFQTTLHGNLYALDEADGRRLWHFKASRCVWGGAAAGTEE